MNSLLLKVFLLTTIVACVLAFTPAVPCSGDDTSVEEIRERIQVLPCGKKKCKLTKNTNTTVIFKFKPKTKVKTLVNKVSAHIIIDLPFIGVDGQDACPYVSRADTGESAPCPLEPDQEYIYKNTFFIEPLYPATNLNVHWSLNQGNNHVICFEVPAVIVNAPAKKSN